MDERSHPRHAAGVEAVVEHQRLGKLTGQIRDVSANGLFVELPPRADLHPIAGHLSKTPITVRYRLPKGPAGRPCIWRGYVARVGSSGLGASISDPRPSGDPNLVRLVDYARRGPERRGDLATGGASKSH